MNMLNQELVDAANRLLGSIPYTDGINDSHGGLSPDTLQIIATRVREVPVADGRTGQVRLLSDVVLSTALQGSDEPDVFPFRFVYLAPPDAEVRDETFTLDMDTGVLRPPELEPVPFEGDPAREFLLRLGQTAAF